MSTHSPRLVLIATLPTTLDGFFLSHIRFLKKRGVEVHLISSPGRQLQELSEEENVEVHAVPISRSISPLRDCRSLLQLVRVIWSVRPDIVHVCTPKANLLGPIAARLCGVPVVVSSVFGLAQMTKHGVMKRALDLATWIGCRLSNRVWCDSRSMADYVVAQGLCKRDNVITLGEGSVAGVDATSRFSARGCKEGRRLVREEFHIPADVILFGFVGRVTKDKGIAELTSAWTLLRERSSSEHLLLVGEIDDTDPPPAESVQVLEQDPRVHVAGFRTDVPSLLAAMDVFVMPSYREGFCISNLEASAMGLPIVSTCIPGCVDSVLDGVTGVLVPPRDTEALADAMWAYSCDSELRAEHGRAGRDRVLEQFQPDDLCSLLHGEYCRLLAITEKGKRKRKSRASIPG